MEIDFCKGAVGLALACVAAAPLQAEFLVTQSSGEIARQYRQGMLVPESTVFELAAGDRVTVLTNDGTRQFAGPGNFTTGDFRAITENFFWLTARQSDVPRVAVMRMEIWPPAPDILRPFNYLWELDIESSGRFCYLSEHMLEMPFWGIDLSETDADRIIFTRLATGDTRQFDYDPEFQGFRNDQGWLHGWPLGLPIEPGDRYEIGSAPTAIRAFPIVIEFVPIGVDPYDGIDATLERAAFVRQVIARLEEVSDDLEAQGCTHQLSRTREAIGRYEFEMSQTADEVSSSDQSAPQPQSGASEDGK